MVRPALEPRAGWEPVVAAVVEAFRAPRDALALEAQAFEPLEGGWALAAVDGGSAVALEGNGLAVGVTRAAGVAWRALQPWQEQVAPLEVRLLDETLEREIARGLPGLPPPTSPAQRLERWRALRELEAARAMLLRLGEGDLLAVDGPLAQHDWPDAVVQGLAADAARCGITVVGVCKSASARWGGLPLLLAAARAARGTPEPWGVPLPGGVAGVQAWAVRFLHGGRVFKLELPKTADPAEAVGKLAPWTRDAGYPGYPFPLALAHNRCALDEALVEDVAQALRGEAMRQGVAAGDWEEVFGDFHEVLDRGV